MKSSSHLPTRSRWLADGALCLATLLAYLPVFSAGFVWDDDAHVTRPDLQSWSGLGRIWTEPGVTQQYYPVLHSLFWFEHRLWGQSPLGYHAVNLGLHVAAALLLVRVLGQLLDPTWPLSWRKGCAYGAAALFALHPVGVESVAWIAEQKNTLSTVCALAAVLGYLRFDREPARPARALHRRWGWYAVGTVCFLAALLAKSVTATVPAALLVVLWWRRGRLEGRRDWLPLAPWLALGAAMGWLTAGLERTQIGAQGADFALSWTQRSVLAGRICWFYLGQLAWPSRLSFVYPRWSIDARQPAQWIALAAALALLAICFGVRGRWRGPLAAWLIFGGLLFPALGFFNVYPFIFSYVADHFSYLASLSFCAAVSVGYVSFWRRRALTPAALTVALALPSAVLLTLAVLTSAQARTYRDAETLYRATLARNPKAWLAQLNLGGMLLERGQIAEAKTLLSTAENLQPDYPLTHFDLGQLDLRQGDMAAAAAEFRASLQLRPLDAEARNNLGIALANQGDREAAGEQFAAAVRLRPNYPLALCNWSIVLMQQHRWNEAREHLSAAAQLSPGNPQVQDLLKRLPAP